MIELDNFTIGILIVFAIVVIMILTAKMHQSSTMTKQSAPPQLNMRPKIPVNLWENNKAHQMQMMNMKYENIGDDTVVYNNKPTGLFVIP